MALTPISNSVEFVQDNVPTAAADGDSWLDTSLSPPRVKVFDAGAGTFIEPRSVQNLDAKISNATATDKNSTSEIATGVDNSTTASTVSNNLDAKVSAVGDGVDWASKTPKSDTISLASTFTVNGSGYLLSVNAQGVDDAGVKIDIDGTTVASDIRIGPSDASASPAFIWRFDSSASITANASSAVRIHYVLD